MIKSQLTDNQKKFLLFFSKEILLVKFFYFTGGTCLSEYYLNHRYSEDLDFFSEKEFNQKDISIFLQSNKKVIGNKSIDYQQSFNRNIFQLIYSNNSILKVEFTYFPFKRIDETKKIENMSIDSLKDIAVNKLFTIYQNPRGRDFYDLYFILKKQTEWSLEQLIKLARIKFDFNIDYLQLGTNLTKAKLMIDDPILNKKIDHKIIKEFFFNEAKKIKNNFLI